MKAYIILNKENQERVDNVNSLIAEHNLNEYDLKIFDAIMAKNFPIKQTWGTLGMVGCYLSHLQIWKECIRNNETEPVLIMEDDFKVGSIGFRSVMKTILENVDENWDFIMLGHYNKGNKIDIDNNISISDNWFGMHFYLINPKNLKNKIHLFDKMQTQIDLQIMKLMNKGELNTYLSKTNLVSQSGFKTTVQK